MSSSSNNRGTAPSVKVAEGFKVQQAYKDDYITHAIELVTKKTPVDADDIEKQKSKFNYIWYMKKIGTAKEAMLEVIAQELFRLLIPGHPKTRLAESAEKQTYILSKKVEGFIGLPQIYDSEGVSYKDMLLNNTLSGMGDVVVVAMLMNEVDLKNGNMGRDENNRVVKIDGDCCFARLQAIGDRKNNYDITAAGIDRLPYVDLREYAASNWMSMSVNDKDDEQTRNIRLKLEEISHSPQFRAEVNGALLRVMMLPDELIKKFILRYIPQGDFTDLLFNEIILRRDRLMYAAAQNESFQAYLNSPAAITQYNDYLAELKKFNTTSKNKILESTLEEENLRAHFDRLKEQHKKIKEDKINFNTLDSIAYPLLKLLGEPSFPERKALIDELKAAARIAYERGFSQGYIKACAFAETNIVARIKNLDAFLELDDLVSVIYILLEREPRPGLKLRQEFIDKYKAIAQAPYKMLMHDDASVRSQFDAAIEVEKLIKAIGNFDELMSLDKVALSILDKKSTVEGDLIWMIQQIAQDFYLHPEKPYARLLRRLDLYSSSEDKKDQLKAHAEFYYKVFSISRSLLALAQTDPVPDAHTKDKLMQIVDRLEGIMLNLSNISKQDDSFVEAVDVLSMPIQGVANRRTAIEEMQKMVLSQSVNGNYNEVVLQKEYFYAIDEQIKEISSEMKATEAQKKPLKEDDFYKNALMILNQYAEALYLKPREMGKIRALSRILDNVKQINAINKSFSKPKSAIDALKAAALKACQDPKLNLNWLNEELMAFRTNARKYSKNKKNISRAQPGPGVNSMFAKNNLKGVPPAQSEVRMKEFKKTR